MSWTDDFEMPDFTMHATVRATRRLVEPDIFDVKLCWAADYGIKPYNTKRVIVFCTLDKIAAFEAAKALQRRITAARRLVGLRVNKA